MTDIHYHERPAFDQPVMIMGFNGWPNAGEVSTGTLDYLFRKLDARPLAFVQSDRFYHYSEKRPKVKVDAGWLKEYELPRIRFFYVPGREGESDLILFSECEPDLCWDYFGDVVFRLAEETNTRSIMTLGGVYDNVPHWMPPKISVIYSDRNAKTMMAGWRDYLTPAEYQGPASIHTLLLARARQKRLPAVGLWGHAPIYIQTGNLKIHHMMVKILEQTIGFSMDNRDLEVGVADMDRRIQELMAQNPRLKKYIDDLEAEYQDASPGLSHDQPEINDLTSESSKGKVISLDRFLKRNE